MKRGLVRFIAVATVVLSSQANAQQCSDYIDNDGDGKIDALVELNPANGARFSVGGTGDPGAVRAAVDAAIVAKRFPFARPTRDALVRSDSASWSNSGTTDSGAADIATLSRVCRILGYRDYVSSTCRDGERSGRYPRGKCNFHSPGNNIMWRFRNNTFAAESANPKYGKTWIASITCVNQLPACSDGWDNDGDGLVDRADPGCASDMDNSEKTHDPACTTPTTPSESEQCKNRIDDDKDGAIDMLDPGCSSPEDNNEADGTAQCQNNKDDDQDGLVDMKDPGCSTPQDNNEADGTSQCQNTKDDDEDGLIDMKDPGCSTPQDSNEADESTSLSVGVECVTNNTDGSKTAYFSYNNTTGKDATVKTDATLGTVNQFVTTGVSVPPPTMFKAGSSKGSVVATFTGDSLTWAVRAEKSALSKATASAATPVCAPLTLKAECRSYQNGVLAARLGYVNGNAFELQAPVGALNQFTPGAADRGQPNKFFAGTNKSVFKVPLASNTDVLTWVVNGASVKIDGSLPVCDGECADTPTGNVSGQLDDVAQKLSDLMTRAANVLASAKASSKQDVSAKTARNRTDAERAKKKAAEYEALAKSLTIQFPAVVKTCPQAPQYCETVDRQYAIESLKGLYANQRNSIQRTIARAYFRNTGTTKRGDSLVKQAKDLEQQGLAALAKLPRFETQCK